MSSDWLVEIKKRINIHITQNYFKKAASQNFKSNSDNKNYYL